MKHFILLFCFLTCSLFTFAQQQNSNANGSKSADKGKLVNTKNPTNKTKTTKRSVDPTYPKFVDTGNPEKDNANYKVAKSEWIKNNPEKYKAMTSSEPNKNSTTVRPTRPVVTKK